MPAFFFAEISGTIYHGATANKNENNRIPLVAPALTQNRPVRNSQILSCILPSSGL